MIPGRLIGTAFKLWLFAISYAPLLLILGIRLENVALEWVCIALGLIFFGSAFLLIFAMRRDEGGVYKVTRVGDKGADVAGYLASYILPFVLIPEPGLRDVLAYSLFLVVAAAVYVRSEMLQINPTFYLMGLRVASVSFDNWEGYLITRRKIRPGVEVAVGGLSSSVLVDRL